MDFPPFIEEDKSFFQQTKKLLHRWHYQSVAVLD